VPSGWLHSAKIDDAVETAMTTQSPLSFSIGKEYQTRPSPPWSCWVWMEWNGQSFYSTGIYRAMTAFPKMYTLSDTIVAC